MPINATHLDVVNRLKRVDGHLRSIIEMIAARRECLEVAQQLHAIEKAIHSAKQIYIHDHIDNCLEDMTGLTTREARNSLAEFKEITKYL